MKKTTNISDIKLVMPKILPIIAKYAPENYGRPFNLIIPPDFQGFSATPVFTFVERDPVLCTPLSPGGLPVAAIEGAVRSKNKVNGDEIPSPLLSLPMASHIRREEVNHQNKAA